MFWFILAVAVAGKPYTVQLSVTDEAGQPVTTAHVQLADEGAQTHKVHGQTGLWSGDGFDRPSGERVPFAMGQSLTLDVWADGYEKRHVETVLSAKKRSEIAVVLVAAPAPAPPAPEAAPPPEPAREPEPAEAPI